MKIRFKGLAKLLKAIPNRAHLFPVKVLVNGKNKSFYAIRYKTGNKAMEIVLKQMRIPKDREALFDSKDGKAKNLSEKDILNIYSKAGKPGSLNEFIQANFKKPIVKPRNSSTVDLDSKQMSIDDLINPAEEKNKKERYIKELKSKELKHDYKKARYVADESGEVLWRETELKYNLAITYDNKISEMTSKGQLDNLKAKTSEELEKELSDCRRLKELLGKGYSDNRKLNAEYWTKAIENGVRNLDDLLKFDEDFRNGKYDNKQQEEIQDQEPQEEKLENANGNEENKPTTDELEANEKITQYKNHLESKESDIDIDKVSGNLVRETTAIDYSNAKKNKIKFIDKNSQVSNRADLEHIVGAGVRNLDNVKKIIETVDDDGFWNGYRDFKAQRPNLLEKQGVNSLIVYYNEYSKNNKQEATQGQEPQETKLEFRNVGLNGGLINLILMREGTTRVESKNEYKEVKNIEGLIKQIEPLKDSHTKIKGRAIMDMLGIDADLYSRAGNIPFPTGSIGYCTKLYNKETGECQISEIGLVADRDNPAAETKTAIHECMHARIGLAGKSNLLDLSFGSDTKSSKLADRIEESLVEMAGQAIAHKVHGKEANQLIHSYSEAIVSVLPNIWDSDIFKKSRKNGLLGIGMEIAKRITSKDTNFLNEMVSKNQNVDKELHSKRINAIESKIKDRNDKVEKIQNDTGVSGIASLVEELKRGTISLEGALNSSKYRELAAVLITKFLEDEDIDALEQLALSF